MFGLSWAEQENAFNVIENEIIVLSPKFWRNVRGSPQSTGPGPVEKWVRILEAWTASGFK